MRHMSFAEHMGDPRVLRKREKTKEQQTDSWFRELNDGRIEIMCKAPGFRIRVTAPEQQAWEAVEMFEQWTGLTVQSDRRPRRRVPVMPGQLPMIELESDGSDTNGDSAPTVEETEESHG